MIDDNPFSLPPPIRLDLMDGLRIRSFVTGSHAYGQPNENSDIDIVMLLDENILHLLANQAGVCIATDQYEDKPQSASLRFGKLNIIAVTRREEFDAWFDGTHDCLKLIQERWEQKGPNWIQRDEAKAIMKKAYERRNLEKFDKSGDEEV